VTASGPLKIVVLEGDETGQELLEHAVRVRAHRLDALLRAAQARGGDELHRLRHLARVRDRANAPLQVLRRSH